MITPPACRGYRPAVALEGSKKTFTHESFGTEWCAMLLFKTSATFFSCLNHSLNSTIHLWKRLWVIHALLLLLYHTGILLHPFLSCIHIKWTSLADDAVPHLEILDSATTGRKSWRRNAKCVAFAVRIRRWLADSVCECQGTTGRWPLLRPCGLLAECFFVHCLPNYFGCHPVCLQSI